MSFNVSPGASTTARGRVSCLPNFRKPGRKNSRHHNRADRRSQ
jgi:hypothetical protein